MLLFSLKYPRDVSTQVQSKGIYLTNCLVGPVDTKFTDQSLSKQTIKMKVFKTKMTTGMKAF